MSIVIRALYYSQVSSPDFTLILSDYTMAQLIDDQDHSSLSDGIKPK